MMTFACGIPSVTLEGERADWVKLLEKIDKFEQFGKQPVAWAALLRPIIQRFVRSFNGEHDLDFWAKVFHHYGGGSGMAYLSGWITTFCVWSPNGKCQGPPLEPDQDAELNIPTESLKLELDGVKYSVLNPKNIPIGFCDVDVDLNDNGTHFDCMMVSGHSARNTAGKRMDAVSPMPAWFMFVKEACENPDLVALREMLNRLNRVN